MWIGCRVLIHRWNRNPRPKPQKFSKQMYLIELSRSWFYLNWSSGALVGVGGSDFIGLGIVNMQTYIYVYIYLYTYIYTYTHACVYIISCFIGWRSVPTASGASRGNELNSISRRTYIYIYIYIYIHIYTHTCMHIIIRIHVCVYIYIYTYVCAYMFVCAYIYIYIIMNK